MCKFKDEGGLGVKDLRSMNLTLLSKWRWIGMVEMSALWKDIIFARYGAQVSRSSLGVREIKCRKVTHWWRGLSKLMLSLGQQSDWFVASCKNMVGDDMKTRFWHDVWVGSSTLYVSFERLFLISEHKP